MRRKWLACILVILTLLAATLAAKDGPAGLVGTYANLSFNVDGAGGQNRLMPRLELRADYAYRWGRETGTYEYRDGRVYLSGSYASWGPGRVDKDSKIWFEYRKNGKLYTVTMYRVSEK